MSVPFRLKIALLAGSMAVVLLLGTGALLWQLTNRYQLERIDQQIRELGQSNLNREHGPAHWQRFEDSLAYIMDANGSSPFLFIVLRSDGSVLHRSAAWPDALDSISFPKPAGPLLKDETRPPAGAGMRPPEPILPKYHPVFERRALDGREWRFGVMGNIHNTLVIGLDIGTFSSDMIRLRRAFLAALPFILLVTGTGAWLLAGRALRPLTTLTRTAETITASGLDQRIPAAGDAEFNRLVTVFNAMLDRLETSFHQALRFSADASHELKTPLARLQAEVEQAMAATPADSPQQEVYSSIAEEIHRLKAIVDKLLLLSLADSGRLQPAREPVDLGKMLAAACEDCRLLAPGIEVHCTADTQVTVAADPQLLERALHNLLDNAVKFNVPGGRVVVSLAAREDFARIRIANTGAGIPDDERHSIFERFHRSRHSRNARLPGSGLGLSLAREIVRAHGGDLVLEPDREGLTAFCVTLPRN